MGDKNGQQISRRTFLRRTTGILAGIPALVALSACAPAAAPGAAPGAPAAKKALFPYKHGLAPYQDELAATLGSKFGWYEEEGLAVELIQFDDYQQIAEALAAGALHSGDMPEAPLIAASEKFPDHTYVYPRWAFDNAHAIMIRPGSLETYDEVLKRNGDRAGALKQTADQLNGKTVILQRGTAMEFMVFSFIRNAGLATDTDVKIIDMNAPDGLAAFIAGTGDAYMGGLPQRKAAEKQGLVPLIQGLQFPEVAQPVAGVSTTHKFVDGQRDELLAFLKVWHRIIRWVNGNIEDAGKMITEELNGRTGSKMTLDDFKSIWGQLEHFYSNSGEAQKVFFDSSGHQYWKPRWEAYIDYYVNKKVLTRMPELDRIMRAPEIQEAFLKKYGPDL